MRRSRAVVTAVAITLSLVPAVARADAGTPLMWLGVFHLFIGNALIGVGEGLLIAFIFRARKLRAIAMMVVANYFSMLVGIFLIGLVASRFEASIMGEEGFYRAVWALWLMGIGSWVLSVILEWPFCVWILREKPNRARKAILASLIAQTASYAVLVPLYLSAGSVDLYTKVKLDRSLEFARDVHATVYFINPKDGAICRICANGSGLKKILDAGLTKPDTRLFFRLSSDLANLDLWAAPVTNFASAALLLPGVSSASSTNVAREVEMGDAPHFYSVKDLRAYSQRDWQFQAGFWPVEGLQASNNHTGESLHLALETPFVSFSMSCPTVMPSNVVVFAANNQVLILDVDKRKIGLLAYGRGPAVVLGDCP
jgi:hypothetical protein